MPTCWVKVSGSERISKPPYEAALPFAQALVETAPDRVLWGTDFPHPNLAIPADEADLVDLLPQVATTAEARQRLLVDNPARLYGFAENQASGTHREPEQDLPPPSARRTLFSGPWPCSPAVSLLGLDAWAAAQAQSAYPTKPVRVVVPFGAGGIADTSLRIVAEKLSLDLGQQVIVDNQPGAGGIIAATTVRKAEADGYTLALLTNGTAISVPLFEKLPFDPLTDFAPVSSVAFFDFVLVTNAQSPLRSVADVIAAAREGARQPQCRHDQYRQQPEPVGGAAEVDRGRGLHHRALPADAGSSDRHAARRRRPDDRQLCRREVRRRRRPGARHRDHRHGPFAGAAGRADRAGGRAPRPSRSPPGTASSRPPARRAAWSRR